MKFRAAFKSPEALRVATRDVASQETRRRVGEAPDEDTDDIRNDIWDELVSFAKKWVKYGELVTIEFDTEAGTATVVPVSS